MGELRAHYLERSIDEADRRPEGQDERYAERPVAEKRHRPCPPALETPTDAKTGIETTAIQAKAITPPGIKALASNEPQLKALYTAAVSTTVSATSSRTM
jgi:hypothetical protein